MKVLIVNSLYEPYAVGGAERVVRTLAEGLRDAGDEPVVVSLTPERGRSAGEVSGVRVHYLPLHNLYWPYGREEPPGYAKPLYHAADALNPRMGHALGRVLDEERPALVHTHNLAGHSAAAWRAVRARGLPLVHTLHDYYLLCPRTSMFRDGRNCQGQHLDCRAFTLPRRRLSTLPDAVTGVSRFLLERHLEHGCFPGVRRREVIPNGVPLPDGEDGAPAPGAPGGSLRLGYIGQLTPVKGVSLLLEAVRGLPPGGWELRVAGKGAPEYEAELRALAPPGVEFLGFTTPADFFRHVDVLVVPSLWHEPFGMVIVEAFARGIPVLASRRGGIPEIVEDGRTGWLFDPDEPGSLRERLEALLRDPAAARARRDACVARARDYDPERVLSAYRALYTSVLREEP